MPDNRVIMISGGKGGVGKSSVTSGLARCLAFMGLKVGIIDADLAGPSQAMLFSCGPMNVVDGHLMPALSGEMIAVSSIGLVAHQDTALVWSDVTAAGTVRLLTEARMWADRDVLLLDLPPGQGHVAMELAKRFPGAQCLLVTTGSELALEECGRAAAFLRRMELDVIGVVENMAFSNCPECGSQSRMFEPEAAERTAARLRLPLLARLPFGSGVASGEGLGQVAEMLIESYATGV